MKFKLYTTKANYTKELVKINQRMGFPSKKGTISRNRRWREVTFNKVMTRTWADENPRITLTNKYPLPIEGTTNLTGLVDYNENWYSDELITKKL